MASGHDSRHKPRVTFYDGGDWSALPPAATPYAEVATEFINDMPSHPMVQFARQWLTDIGTTPPAVSSNYYKTSLVPCSGASVGPLYARNLFGNAGRMGKSWLQALNLVTIIILSVHFTIQRGADYLIQNGPGYGDSATLPWHILLHLHSP